MIYYELTGVVADLYHNGVRYWASKTKIDNVGSRLLQHSERAWLEEDDTVRFIKHRETGIMTPVDMREFFLVKLRSSHINLESR